MPATDDNRPRCAVCDEPFHPNRWWQRYCSAFCCTEFHRRERQQMRQWWRVQQEVDRYVARVDEAMQAQSADESLRRRL
jgi:hypothetical protein